MADPLAVARALRRFNRFYTRRLGLLDASHLQSAYSLPEVRVLYEVHHRDHATASDIAAALQMDEGYLSRLLRRLRQSGLIRARRAPEDARQHWLSLTAAGKRTFRTLDARATQSVVELIEHLSPPEQEQLVGAVTRVETLLEDVAPMSATAEPPVVELRAPAPGDLGWVVARHGELYSREYSWNGDFERLVARIVGEFAANPVETRQQCWIATVGSERAGCIFLMPGAEATIARLRLLLVEPRARDHGVGALLVRTCIHAAREAGYKRLTLWTNDVLTAARRIYEREGFELTHSEPHQSFGPSLIGQTWDLDLSRPLS